MIVYELRKYEPYEGIIYNELFLTEAKANHRLHTEIKKKFQKEEYEYMTESMKEVFGIDNFEDAWEQELNTWELVEREVK